LVKHERPIAALFGGSFDPPHIGHVRIVETVLKHLDIDTLIIEPTWRNPFKSGYHASPQQRLTWTKKLFEGNPKIVVDDYEVRKKCSVPTYETLQHLNDTYDIRYIVIGADNVAGLPQWHRFDALNEAVTWVILTREGYDIDTSALRNVRILKLDVPVSSTQIRTKKALDFVDETIRNEVKKIYNIKDTTDES
jgi:nicotinate-nucleotide adenylyltransferase